MSHRRRGHGRLRIRAQSRPRNHAEVRRNFLLRGEAALNKQKPENSKKITKSSSKRQKGGIINKDK